MPIGAFGIKCGMTRLFTETGRAIPVSVIRVAPHYISQVKTADKEGYAAIQVTTLLQKAARLTKPQAGHFRKAGVEAGRIVREFLLTPEEVGAFKLGDELGLDRFSQGQFVDVRGKTKGKGFQGAVKRHHFKTQDATHGNSLSHRAPGSTGQCQTPGRVFKGKKMAGQMGNQHRTIQNQQLVQINLEEGLLLISGAVPGPPGACLLVMPAKKYREQN